MCYSVDDDLSLIWHLSFFLSPLKVSRPGEAEDATVLTPHSSAPQQPALASDKVKSVRSKRKTDAAEVSNFSCDGDRFSYY